MGRRVKKPVKKAALLLLYVLFAALTILVSNRTGSLTSRLARYLALAASALA